MTTKIDIPSHEEVMKVANFATLLNRYLHLLTLDSFKAESRESIALMDSVCDLGLAYSLLLRGFTEKAPDYSDVVAELRTRSLGDEAEAGACTVLHFDLEGASLTTRDVKDWRDEDAGMNYSQAVFYGGRLLGYQTACCEATDGSGGGDWQNLHYFHYVWIDDPELYAEAAYSILPECLRELVDEVNFKSAIVAAARREPAYCVEDYTVNDAYRLSD